MLDYVLDLFSSAQFVPHAVCLLWRPDLLIMHAASDFLISVAYLTIPFVILKAVKRRPDLLDPKLARLFAAFITACALSHLAGLLTLWVPAYGLQGVIKVATAAVSIFTAIELARALPVFLTLPSRAEMVQKEADIAVEQQRTQDAEEARDKLSEFAYIASHDLKAPMRGIANQAKFLIEDHAKALKPDALKRLDRIQELCGQLETLVSTLLKYSRIGRFEAHERIDPAEIVGEITSSISELLEERNAQVILETHLPTIIGDPSEVMTVLSNLIINGLKYNDAEEKQIRIGFSEQLTVHGRTMRDVYYVRDNGIGIDPEFHDEVFRMFKRLHQPEAYGQGTGAGLAFVKKVVENNGGSIEMVSAPEQGSTFYFSVNPMKERQKYAVTQKLRYGNA